MDMDERLARSLALGALRLLAGFLLVFWVALWGLPLFGHTFGRAPGQTGVLAVALAAMVVSLGYLVFCAAPRRTSGHRIRGRCLFLRPRLK